MKKGRINIAVGQRCRKCRKDRWLVYQGYNRCECGQYLWIERKPGKDRHYQYSQGVSLPDRYRGWMAITA